MEKKRKYLKAFATGDGDKAKAFAKKVGGCVKMSSYVTGVRSYGMAVAVDTYYVYSKKDCKRKK